MDMISELINSNISGNVTNATAVKYLSLIGLIVLLLLLCFVAYYIAKKFVKFIIPKYIKKWKSRLGDILYEKGFYNKLAHILPIIIVYMAEPLFNEYSYIVEKVAGAYLAIVFVQITVAALDSIDESYKQYEISKTRPITAALQVIKIVVYIIAIILFVAILIGENPLTLIGGLGALSAVFSLVFKDPILGFVAGIQLTSTDMLRVGDWIKVAKYDAEGTVTEIALTTIKIQQFDKNIITVPNYSLVSDSFVNMRGFQDLGARRFRRSIYIDIVSIRISTEEEIKQYLSIDYLRDYIINKAKDLSVVNFNPDSLTEEVIDELGITNIEILRVSGQNYLDNHPMLRKDLALMFRSLAQEERGIQLEVTAFADTTVWVEYEAIQEDVFDRLYLIADKLGLRAFQNPSGYDMQQVASKY